MRRLNTSVLNKFHFLVFVKLVLFLLLTFGNTLAQIPTNGLKGHWKLDGNAIDASGNNNNGTLQGGAVYCEDRFGVANSAVKFGGYFNSSAIQISNSPSLYLTNALTIACWTKLDDPTGMDNWGNYSATNCGQTFIAKDGDRSGFLLHYKITPSELYPYFGIYNNNTCSNIPTFSYLDVQSCVQTEWIHTAVVVDYNHIGETVLNIIATDNNLKLTFDFPQGIYLVRAGERIVKVVVVQ